LFGLFAYKRVVSGVGIGCECLDRLLGFIFVGLIVVNILGYIKLGLSILLECFLVSLFFGMKIFFIQIYI
jgi:hypothetical protein